ncbi:hypothetical protein IAQ61_005625 [Plenodomus lingam]|uniref:uncharacterized protein n=1 Tax=Leptosphaeria maculans TaxID=5022 RepID=UPI0033255ED4|nr:hypothetical protein IAQ61_005625 [Plenodomus lingam]
MPSIRQCGRHLVATVPLGALSHPPNLNNATCEALRSEWQTEKIQCAKDATESKITTDILLATPLLRQSWHYILLIKAVTLSNPTSALASLETTLDTLSMHSHL